MEHLQDAVLRRAAVYLGGAADLGFLLKRGRRREAVSRGTTSSPRLCALLAITLLAPGGTAAYAQVINPRGPTLTVTPAPLPTSLCLGPCTWNGPAIPGLYTWGSPLGLSGAKWYPGETVEIHLYGPLNSIGASPTDRVLGEAYADSSGNLVSFSEFGYVTDSLYIPFNRTNSAQYYDDNAIPRPGYYELQGIGSHNNLIFGHNRASVRINLCPDTLSAKVPGYECYPGLGWPVDRGGRDGWLGDISPERADPEWISVWSEQPVGLYATIAPTQPISTIDDPPSNQPCFITHADLPFTHYGHDVNMELVPDPEYKWVLGTANFVAEITDANQAPQTGKANYGRIECEWETLNNGTPTYGSYGQGNIGMPLWVMPTAGDRVYMVGRWVMDNGHPDTGDRTEIHPPRLLATMRKRNTAIPFGAPGSSCVTRASQVDVYVSGHGGGCNEFPDGLSAALNNNGAGGGLIGDVLSGDAWTTYFAYGPASGDTKSVYDLLASYYRYITEDNVGSCGDGNIKSVAGPSALGWAKGPEDRPVNDMDYDFDAPLPPPPPGATQPLVRVARHVQDTGAVTEQITYTHPDPATGLPTVAHIHLPFSGAPASSIYGRTLYFYWDQYSTPGHHFVVQIDDVKISRAQIDDNKYLGPEPLYLWTDVCGQWASLTDLDPQDMLHPEWANAPGYDRANFPGAKFDVYLDNWDTLRVFTQGYAQRDFDSLFGVTVGETAYDAGVQLAKLQELGTGENKNPGGALFDSPIGTGAEFEAVQGPHAVDALHAPGKDYLTTDFGFSLTSYSGSYPCPDPPFIVDFTVTFVPRPPHAYTAEAPPDFGPVCLDSSEDRQVRILNGGEEPLIISAISVSGAGYSLVSPPNLPVTVTEGGVAGYLDLTVRFSPTAPDQGAGTLTVTSSDPCNPVLTIPLTASVISGSMSVSPVAVSFPPTVIGCSSSRKVTVFNTGPCALTVAPTISGAGYSLEPFLGNAQGVFRVASGASTTLSVDLAPTSIAHSIPGTLTLYSNDPAHPLTIVALCGEGVLNGARVLVLQAGGAPYPMVDQITVTGNGAAHSGADLRNVPLTTINPPESCEPIEYHADLALPPASTAGQNGGAYTLFVRVKNKHQSLRFDLDACQFKPITITLP